MHSYQLPVRWRKFLPTDLPSVWWFTDVDFRRLWNLYLAAAKNGGPNLPVRALVRQFRGATSTATAKRICESLPFRFLGDASDTDADRALEALRQHTSEPLSSVLGSIGKPVFEQFFRRQGAAENLRYQRLDIEVHRDGARIPYVVEIAYAPTADELTQQVYYGINFSPAYDDPFTQSWFEVEDVEGRGIGGLLENVRAEGLLVVHLVCPNLSFLDFSKSAVDVPKPVAEAVANALWSMFLKRCWGDFKRFIRDAQSAERRRERLLRQFASPKTTKRKAVFASLPQAVEKASAGGRYRVSLRNLYYACRPAVYEATGESELDYPYFDKLVLAYELEHGEIEALYRDPRGVLYHPHSNLTTPMGTLDVEKYEFPDWEFSAILFVEKRGLWPILEDAGVGPRFDLAIIASEGFSPVAVRRLLAKASKERNYKILCLHDADPAGYEIGRTLAEETERMPGHQIDVSDIGLNLEEAIDLDLQSERFKRTGSLSSKLVERLSPVEREWFQGSRVDGKTYLGRRIELNAFLPADLIAFVEDKLEQHGVRKVLPPAEIFREHAEIELNDQARELVQRTVLRLVDVDAIVAEVTPDLRSRLDLAGQREHVRARLEQERALPWRQTLYEQVRSGLELDRSFVETSVRERLRSPD